METELKYANENSNANNKGNDDNNKINNYLFINILINTPYLLVSGLTLTSWPCSLVADDMCIHDHVQK